MHALKLWFIIADASKELIPVLTFNNSAGDKWKTMKLGDTQFEKALEPIDGSSRLLNNAARLPEVIMGKMGKVERCSFVRNDAELMEKRNEPENMALRLTS